MSVASVAAQWDAAPALIEGAKTLELSAADCDLKFWLSAVPQGTLRGHVAGHAPGVLTPEHMRTPGPLRESLSRELAFRSLAEDKAARAISFLVAEAPTTDTMEFYATQLIDEARHAMVFRNHLIELEVATDATLVGVIDKIAGADRDAILNPLEEFGLRDKNNFINGVVTLTILVEGVLAPMAELSERKWRPLDPAAADIERGAGIDEIRHLSVGSWVAKNHLEQHPGDKPAILDHIAEGMKLWDQLPVKEQIYRRELLFQEGLLEAAAIVGDYEIWPGTRLIDTTAEQRLLTALEWSAAMREARLRYIGLEEVLV